jgi:SAM-dependent methyltransferase
MEKESAIRPEGDPRRYSPAVARNREPLLSALRELLPDTARVLEIASGSGEHAVFFCSRWPGLRWQPSDPDPAARASIDAWRAPAATDRVAAALDLDVSAPDWPVCGAFDAVVCCNMIHIAPWQACIDLFSGAARILGPGSLLVLYGPFFVAGEPPATGNLRFDADLRARNASWGVRALEDVSVLAQSAGFEPARRIPMPANNQVVAFRRRA